MHIHYIYIYKPYALISIFLLNKLFVESNNNFSPFGWAYATHIPFALIVWIDLCWGTHAHQTGIRNDFVCEDYMIIYSYMYKDKLYVCSLSYPLDNWIIKAILKLTLGPLREDNSSCSCTIFSLFSPLMSSWTLLASNPSILILLPSSLYTCVLWVCLLFEFSHEYCVSGQFSVIFGVSMTHIHVRIFRFSAIIFAKYILHSGLAQRKERIKSSQQLAIKSFTSIDRHIHIQVDTHLIGVVDVCLPRKTLEISLNGVCGR